MICPPANDSARRSEAALPVESLGLPIASPDVRRRTVPGPVPGNVKPRQVQFDFFVQAVSAPQQLYDILADWQSLTADSIEPNIFYEPCVVLPALRHLVGDHKPQFVLVFGRNRGAPTHPPVLCGFFPLLSRRISHGLPLPSWTMWGHANCFLRTPLIRNGVGEEVLEAFFDWLQEQRMSLIEFQQVTAEGWFHKLLTAAVHRRNYLSWVSECFTRALLVREGTAEAYLREAVTGKHLKELRRQESRLAELGELTYETLPAGDCVRSWAEDFMALEGSGWKGKEHSAFESSEAGRSFFSELLEEAANEQKLRMLALKLDGRTVASKCNLYTGKAAFAFKICFDEDYSKYSPGVLLEIENIRCFFEQETADVMDSCAEPDHPMINRLWKDRRCIQSLLVSTGGLGDIGVAGSPVLRWLKRRFVSRNR